MEIEKFVRELRKLSTCQEAVTKIRDNYKTSQKWWEASERGDWMLRLIGRKAGKPWGEKRKKLVLTSCKCARLVWDSMPHAGKDCIFLFERWANGKNISTDDLFKAKHAAANAAAYTAYAAAYAAYATPYTAQPATLKQCADIVRKDYPNVDDLFKE